MGWVANAIPRPLYPRERPGTHFIRGWVSLRAGLDRRGKSGPSPRGTQLQEKQSVLLLILLLYPSSSVNTVTRLWATRLVSRFYCTWRQMISFSIASRQFTWPSARVLGDLSLPVKRPWLEGSHDCPSSAKANLTRHRGIWVSLLPRVSSWWDV